MRRMLSIEWFILKRSKIFWVIILLAILAQVLFPYVIYSFSVGSENLRFNLIEQALSFPYVYNTITVINLLPVQIMCLYLLMVITNEFETSNNRIFILASKSKTYMCISKFALALSFTLFFTILAFLISLVFGLMHEDSFAIYLPINTIKTFGIYSIQVFTYMAYAMFIALVVKKTGLSIIIYLLYFGVVDRTLTQIINHWFNLKPFGNYLPGKSVELLNVLEVYKEYTIHHKFEQINKFLIVIFWILACVLINMFLYKKSEL